jgi:metal-dependent HD superfamily phosphatase/phosphodiesterase
MKVEFNKIKYLWNLCSNFVYKVCNNRDESHGPKHMELVAKNAFIIFNELDDFTFTIDDLETIIISAWMHDVSDHKYDKDGKMQIILDNFLDLNFPSKKYFINNIIKRISFTKEYDAMTNNIKYELTTQSDSTKVWIKIID